MHYTSKTKKIMKKAALAGLAGATIVGVLVGCAQQSPEAKVDPAFSEYEDVTIDGMDGIYEVERTIAEGDESLYVSAETGAPGLSLDDYTQTSAVTEDWSPDQWDTSFKNAAHDAGSVCSWIHLPALPEGVRLTSVVAGDDDGWEKTFTMQDLRGAHGPTITCAENTEGHIGPIQAETDRLLDQLEGKRLVPIFRVDLDKAETYGGYDR